MEKVSPTSISRQSYVKSAKKIILIEQNHFFKITDILVCFNVVSHFTNIPLYNILAILKRKWDTLSLINHCMSKHILLNPKEVLKEDKRHSHWISKLPCSRQHLYERTRIKSYKQWFRYHHYLPRPTQQRPSQYSTHHRNKSWQLTSILRRTKSENQQLIHPRIDRRPTYTSRSALLWTLS